MTVAARVVSLLLIFMKFYVKFRKIINERRINKTWLPMNLVLTLLGCAYLLYFNNHLKMLRTNMWMVRKINKEAGRLYAELLSLADDIWHPHVVCTSCRRHPHIIHMSSAHHEDNILMSSTCHLHIQNLPELPNFMTWLVFICYIVSAESLILSLIFGWTLSVQDVLLISFGRKFCNLFLDQFGFEYCFWYMFCFWLDLPVLGQQCLFVMLLLMYPQTDTILFHAM